MAVTRTPRVPNPIAVPVKPSAGEYLWFTLRAGGPVPIFSLASHVKGTLIEAPDFPEHPTSLYEWPHLKNPSDIQQLELLNLGLAFLTNAQYDYTLERRDGQGGSEVVFDISFTGDPTDTTEESFRVVIVA
jgi:hypothetical protein